MTDGDAALSGEREASGNETRRLRLFFLAPLLLAILATVLALIAANYYYHRRDIEAGIVQLRTSAAGLYEESVQQNMHALHTIMDVLERDDFLREALARRDRRALLAHAAPLFDDMRRNYGITHFYFTDAARVNLLRVHQPKRYGDVIDRVTTMNAERSGAMASGVELGPLGLFTLRLVSPWYDPRTRRLLGYVELGMEIDKVLENIHNLFGLDIHVFIKKEFLRRESWEEGMRVLGRTPDWDRFPDTVLSVQAPHELPAAFTSQFAKAGSRGAPASLEMVCNGHPCQAMLLPLVDVGGRRVAEMVMVADTSQQVADARQAVMIGSAVSVTTGAALFILFYWLVGRIGRRLECDARQLQELASHDGLTGLYNHRMFYSLLEDEIARMQRHQRPVALLMLDIDHFKRINDAYGHMAGDRILAGMARLLQQAMRQEDRVCRYGGEEIGVIMPETPAPAAMQAAERLRAAVERASFRDDSGQEIRITVSIGAAALPEHAMTLQELVSAADSALYAAKEGGRNRICQYEKPLAAGPAA